MYTPLLGELEYSRSLMQGNAAVNGVGKFKDMHMAGSFEISCSVFPRSLDKIAGFSKK